MSRSLGKEGIPSQPVCVCPAVVIFQTWMGAECVRYLELPSLPSDGDCIWGPNEYDPCSLNQMMTEQI
jgi:hypothetical protein